eukprot:1264004-Prymnesium_polylepis.1
MNVLALRHGVTCTVVLCRQCQLHTVKHAAERMLCRRNSNHVSSVAVRQGDWRLDQNTGGRTLLQTLRGGSSWASWAGVCPS